MCLAGPAQAQSGGTAQSDALLLACRQSLACKSHLDRATELYRQERYGVALEEYQAAYILQPYPPILYNIARLHHKQNQLAEAIAYYQRYLDTADPAQAERAKQLLSEVQQELALRRSEPPRAALLPASPSVLGPSVTPAAQPAFGAAMAPVAPAERPASLPAYKKGWVWALVGVAAAGAATAIGLGVYASGPDISGLPAKTATLGR